MNEHLKKRIVPRKTVEKAGVLIVRSMKGEKIPSLSRSYGVLYLWRKLHAYPMQAVYMLVKRNAASINPKAISAQRLKRFVSISRKLFRQNGMSLARMEDIAGCRIILENTAEVYALAKKLKSSSSRHKLHRERDYINAPKESGYRGYHMIYKYEGTNHESCGLPVEVQIRSKLQHVWATAVEVVGTFTNQALKSSQGDKEWLDFFAELKLLFQKMEGDIDILPENYRSALLEYYNKLKVDETLSAFNISARHISQQKYQEFAYIVLNLDMLNRKLNFKTFTKSELEQASNYYSTLEELRDENKDAVLIRVESLSDLRRAYPNYFADTRQFLTILRMFFKPIRPEEILKKI